MFSAEEDHYTEAETQEMQRWRVESLLRRTDVRAGGPPGREYLYRPGQLLYVRDENYDVTSKFVLAEIREAGGRPDEKAARTFDRVKLPLLAFSFPLDVDLPALVDRLRRPRGHEPVPNVALNHVLTGEPNYHGGPAGEPWNAKGFASFASGAGQGDPVVAILDTGYDPSVQQLHPALYDRLQFFADDTEDAVAPDGYLALEGGHGTFIAGIFMQMLPQARVLAAKALHPDGDGDDQTLAVALAEATGPGRAGIKVLNLSLGGYTQDDTPPPALSAALAQLGDSVAVVAAAGNNHQDRPFWPAALDAVVAVGALDTRGGQIKRARFSNYGSWVDVYAPGVRILSTYLDATWMQPWDPQPRSLDGFARWSGTSFAAPQVAALIAAQIMSGTAPQAAVQEVLGQAQLEPGLGWILLPNPGVVG